MHNAPIQPGHLATLQDLRFKGRTYGFPMYSNVAVITYNTEIFKQAGIPHAPRDLDELAEGRHWAQHRLAFEELLTHQLSMQRLRDSLRNQHAPALPKAQRLPGCL